jgi:hypothetical protein
LGECLLRAIFKITEFAQHFLATFFSGKSYVSILRKHWLGYFSKTPLITLLGMYVC